jgi:hypothetical protein
LIVIRAGLFRIAAAIFNWEEWFYDANSRGIEMLGGQQMVRWFWLLSGLFLIFAAVAPGLLC